MRRTKRSDCIVRCQSSYETNKVVKYFEGPNIKELKHWDYVYINNGRIELLDNLFSIRYSGIRIIDYKEWIKLSEPKEEEEENKIAGYKLVKPEYRKAVYEILGEEAWFETNFDNNVSKFGYNFGEGDHENSVCNRIRKAGVLDLWFEPVYESDLVKKDETVEEEKFKLPSGVELTNQDILDAIKLWYEKQMLKQHGDN